MGSGVEANLVGGTREVGELLLELYRLFFTTTQQIVVTVVESSAVFYTREFVCILTEDCLLSGKEVVNVGSSVNGGVLEVSLGCVEQGRLV